MPAPYPDAFIDQCVEMYRAGKSFAKIGAELGKDGESLRVAVRNRGIELPRRTYPSTQTIPMPTDLSGRYAEGQSVQAMAKHYGVSRPLVIRWLKKRGLPIRTSREASLIKAAAMSPAQREAQAANAHAATRGRTVGRDEKWRRAEAIEQHAIAGTRRRSAGEILLGQWLRERGIDFIPEKRVDRYNVDFGIEPVAVELLGGHWHSQPSRRRFHAERTHDILNAGWHMIFIWSGNDAPISPDGADELVSYIQEARLHPATVGQYWVLRGDGKLVASGGDEGDKFTLIVPPVTDLTRRSRN